MANNAIDRAIGQIGSVTSSTAAILVGVGIAAVLGIKAVNNKRPFNLDQLVTDNLIFPRDLANYPLSMCFDFMEYKRRAVNKQPHLKPSGKIRLPVAKGIVDKINVLWKDKNQTPMVGAAIESILEENQTLRSSDIGSIGSRFVESVVNVGGDTAAGFGITKANELLGKTGDAFKGEKLQLADILQPFGLAVNPFLTVMFESPEFKTHNFNWKLIPRDPEETRIINKMIRLFKYAQLPAIAQGSGGTLMNYPNIVQVSFYGNDNYLYRFKPCAIQTVSVNYAPAATPSFFKGSQNIPTEIDFSISIKEIEYWTKMDFERGYDPNIEVAPR